MRWRIGLIAAAVVAAIVPIPARAIEALYSTRIFPVVQRVTTTVSNLVPFALFDVLIIAVTVWWLVQFVREMRTRRRDGWARAVGRLAMRTITIAAAAYLVFLLAWGFNYRRVPVEEKLQFDPSRVSAEAAVALAGRAVEQVNALYEPAHRMGWLEANVLDRPLADAFALARRQLGSTAATVPGVPKRTMFDLYFRRAGVAGMTDPYFLETFVASDLLPFERSFVIAHEWSHLAGIAEEGDANFLGWLTCVRGTPAHQYSGWLSLYSEVAGSLGRKQVAEVSAKLGPGPRADLRAINDRLLRNINPQVSAAGWRVYDSYLKANNVEAGAASYAEVVRLVLGTAFDTDWKPQLRP